MDDAVFTSGPEINKRARFPFSSPSDRVVGYIKERMMSHTHRDRDKLLARVRRLKGQMEAVERALEAEKPCGEVLQLLASIRGALSGLTGEVMQDHLHEHILHAENDADRAAAAEDLAAALRTYIR